MASEPNFSQLADFLQAKVHTLNPAEIENIHPAWLSKKNVKKIKKYFFLEIFWILQRKKNVYNYVLIFNLDKFYVDVVF